MSSNPKIDDVLREAIISQPDVILDDTDVMQALIAANEKAMGGNIVDLRGIAMERLETRLDRLEDTHRSVIAAAYENLAGTNQIHRAILRMLDPTEFETFLAILAAKLPIFCASMPSNWYWNQYKTTMIRQSSVWVTFSAWRNPDLSTIT